MIYKEDVEDITYLPSEMSIEAFFYYLDKGKKPQRIKSLEGIENLKNLKVLDLCSNDIKDIEPLRNLTDLEELDLNNNQINDISPLKNFTNLKKLKLINNKIKDIEPLRNLTNLEQLYLGNFMLSSNENYNQISDITPLKNLVNLKRLDLDRNNINDISILSNLTGLENLELQLNDIEDIKPLFNIKNLKCLNLNNNRIKDISILKNLNNLEYLYLGKNNISDISSLSNLNNLNGLRLSNNNIKDITALTNLKKLEYLCLDSNNITDITALTNLEKIEYLYLSSNDITDYTPISKYYKNIIRKDFKIKENAKKSSSKSRRSSSDNKLIAKSNKQSSIKAGDVKIEIPDGASDFDLELNVEKVRDISKLKNKSTQKYISDVYEITKDRKGNFNKMITITLPFNKTNVDIENQDIGIFLFNEDAKEWIKLENIKVDIENSRVSGDVNHFTKFAVLATEKREDKSKVKLKDIKNHWAESNINEMIQSGIITGYKDSTFKPNNNITRAEFCKLIVKAFNLDSKDGNLFIDTKNHWAKGIISTAQANGIVSGYDNNMFRPNDLITREEMAVMIVRAAKFELKESNKSFDDDKDISSWANNSIETAVENKILNGYPENKLKPKGYATRAEAVTMIIKAINF